MSTLAATNLKHASSASNNIVLDSSGTATFTGALVPASSFLRNRIINGGMEIAQRGTSGTSGYLLDRWITSSTSAQSQSSDAPTGFINSLEFTSSSATFPNLAQRIERLNSYDLAGRVVTFSFWAKSVSGSSSLYVEIYRANANDNFSSITLEGLVVLTASPSASWTFYSGSITLSASATTGVELRIIRDNTSAASTRVTGVQLEVGSAATPFERRQYGQELALCQRYYQVGFAAGRLSIAATEGWPIQYKVTMRATPTITFGTAYSSFGLSTGPAADNADTNGFTMRISGAGDHGWTGPYSAAIEL